MIKIEKTSVRGWEEAIRGLRNSFDSWDKSDSDFSTDPPTIGNADLTLMKKLASSGDSHSKFLRYITVTFDITAPRYWWAEADTYKVGTVRNSCSTMHTITKYPFKRESFSYEYIDPKYLKALDDLIFSLNSLREEYLSLEKETDTTSAERKKEIWYTIIQLLPASFNQKATILLNYQVLRHIYRDRVAHKLVEWQDFCRWIEELPSGIVLIANNM